LVLYTGGGGTPDGGGTAYHALTLRSSDRVPVVILPPCGVVVGDPELMPQFFTVCDVKFCHLTDPIVGIIQGCSVISNKGRQLQESVGEGERHWLVVLLVCIVQDNSEILKHFIQFFCVDSPIHPTDAIGCHLPKVHLKGRDQVIITAVTIDTGDTVYRLIILQPEGNVPGLIVGPPVVVGALRNHGGECLHWSVG